MTRMFCVFLVSVIQVQNNFKTNEGITRIADKTIMLVLKCCLWGEIKLEDYKKSLRGKNAI